MNFYKHHLGDYARDTSHLSWMEDHAYTRLLRVYYLRERPIPANEAEIMRLVRAVTRREKEAVTLILNEFFEQREDGWHNKRCDEEILKYQAQAATNRRIAQQRIVNESSNESSTIHTPNHKPDTRYQIKTNTSRKRSSPKTPLPEGFGISERVGIWLEKRGILNAEVHLEHFIGYVKAHGKQYADWDAALMNAIRCDWAKAGDGRKRPSL